MKIIKKIKLKTVEERLGKELKKNTISLGVDPSVHSTGLALIRTTEDYLIIDHFEKLTIPKEVKGEDAIDLFTEQMDNYKNKLSQKYKIDITIVEDCFLQISPKIGGKMGFFVTTLKALRAHGILSYDRLKRVSRVTKFKYPKSARKIVGFNSGKLKGTLLKKEIIKFINLIFDLELKMKENDIADALMLASVGLIKDTNKTSKTKIEKPDKNRTRVEEVNTLALEKNGESFI